MNKVPIQLPNLNADLRALRQIMINLLSNAIKFTDAGTIEISAWLGEDDGLCISVRETGMGIAEADYERVMQPFVQIAQSSTRKHSGSGLGLALVKSLVVQHDGTVEITSTVGIGTTVTCGFSPTQTVMQDIQADRRSAVASAEGIVQGRGGMDAMTSSRSSH